MLESYTYGDTYGGVPPGATCTTALACVLSYAQLHLVVFAQPCVLTYAIALAHVLSCALMH